MERDNIIKFLNVKNIVLVLTNGHTYTGELKDVDNHFAYLHDIKGFNHKIELKYIIDIYVFDGKTEVKDNSFKKEASTTLNKFRRTMGGWGERMDEVGNELSKVI